MIRTPHKFYNTITINLFHLQLEVGKNLYTILYTILYTTINNILYMLSSFINIKIKGIYL